MTKNELWTLGVAIYAAVVGTFALGWDAWKWMRGGPRLRLHAAAGMMETRRSFLVEPKPVVVFDVFNGGDQPATIVGVFYQAYRSRFDAIFKSKPARSMALLDLDPGVPHKISPGEQWLSTSEETAELVDLIQTKVVYVEVYKAGSNKPIRMRLRRV